MRVLIAEPALDRQSITPAENSCTVTRSPPDRRSRSITDHLIRLLMLTCCNLDQEPVQRFRAWRFERYKRKNP